MRRKSLTQEYNIHMILKHRILALFVLMEVWCSRMNSILKAVLYTFHHGGLDPPHRSYESYHIAALATLILASHSRPHCGHFRRSPPHPLLLYIFSSVGSPAVV